MMLSELISVILALFLFSTAVEADTEEDIELRIFNRNTTARLSKTDVLKVLKKANLTGRGFKKDVSYQTVMSPESKSYFKESYFYYKLENCSRIPEIEEELETLIPGVLGEEVANRLKTELQYWHLDEIDKCKVGLEAAFKGIDSDQRSKRNPRDQKFKLTISFKATATFNSKDAKEGAKKGVVKGAVIGAVKGAIAGSAGGPLGAAAGAAVGAVAGAAKGAAKGALIGAAKGGIKGRAKVKVSFSRRRFRRRRSRRSSGGGGL